MSANDIVWQPDPALLESCAMTRFARAQGFQPSDYDRLWRWSLDRPEAFWTAIADFCALRITPPRQVLMPGGEMIDARWFVGSRLNFAENLLARVADDQEVLVGLDERGRRRALTGAQLKAEVARVAAGLRSDGVGPGDRVAGIVPNAPEAVVAMLATASLGAIWTSCSPDFGEQGVLDRFGQVAPKVLFACNGYHYAGRRCDVRERVGRVAARLPSLVRTVRIDFLGDGGAAPPGQVDFADYGDAGATLAFTPIAFDAPLYILYSSGTTGTPKCIVHGAGGTLLQHAKELVLHCDLRVGDVLFYFTTCGWMMWNWLVSGLVAGARLVLYDGSPVHPGPQVLWEAARDEGITHFGASPRYLHALQQSGFRPARDCPPPALRMLLSTGAPLPPEAFDFAREAIAPVQLASISGGTDIISCFLLGNPWLPVRRGTLQGPGLGMAVDVFDAAGRPVVDEAGELVCTRPFPSMPVGFWNDPDRQRYRRAYFARFPGVWHHGDFAIRRRDGGWVILGRSDATLNPGGVRIGTAEIYRVVEAVEGIREAAAVGLRRDGDERVLLFVVTEPGVRLDAELAARLRAAIRSQLSPRHVPARIIEAPALPCTRSGKLSEIAIRDLIHGVEVANAEALANPESLDFFRALGRRDVLAEGF